jgi:hypothetical protein
MFFAGGAVGRKELRRDEIIAGVNADSYAGGITGEAPRYSRVSSAA